MTALAAARMTEMRNPGAIIAYVMKASTTIYAGGLVMLDSNGLALPAVASASNHGIVGVATETVTSAASGTYYIHVQEGEFKMNATSIAQSAVGSKMYSPDDNTVDETQGSNEPIAGILIEYISSTSGWVRVSLNLARG